jgi:hypothetical protein
MTALLCGVAWLVVAVFGWSLVRISAQSDRASGRKR